MPDLEALTHDYGRAIFARLDGGRTVPFGPAWWDERLMGWTMGDEALKKLKRTIPLRRLGTVEELAHAAQFVVENSYFTGTVLELDGGLSI